MASCAPTLCKQSKQLKLTAEPVCLGKGISWRTHYGWRLLKDSRLVPQDRQELHERFSSCKRLSVPSYPASEVDLSSRPGFSAGKKLFDLKLPAALLALQQLSAQDWKLLVWEEPDFARLCLQQGYGPDKDLKVSEQSNSDFAELNKRRQRAWFFAASYLILLQELEDLILPCEALDAACTGCQNFRYRDAYESVAPGESAKKLWRKILRPEPASDELKALWHAAPAWLKDDAEFNGNKKQP